MERLQDELDEAKQQIREQEKAMNQIKPIIRRKKTLEELIAEEMVGHIKDARQEGRESGKASSDREYQGRIVSLFIRLLYSV